MPCFRCSYQGAENGSGGFVFDDRALGMPLHGEHEVVGGGAFQRFDDTVVGAAGGDAEALADLVRGLVMGRVYGQDELLSLSG